MALQLRPTLREAELITTAAELEQVAARLLQTDAVAVDTEFFWERTFYPILGLVQLATGDHACWLVDTVRIPDIRALGPVIVVVDEADAIFGTREADGDSGVSGRVFAAFAAHIGDSTLRGREVWVAMTSRPDLLAIDMKRQGRFGLCIPLFPAQGPDDVAELFTVVAKLKKIALTEPISAYIRENLGQQPLTGSDVEAVLTRAKERAVLASRDNDVQKDDVEEAVHSFIDPLDANLLALQELAAVLACSDRRYLPERYLTADRTAQMEEFARLKLHAGRR